MQIQSGGLSPPATAAAEQYETALRLNCRICDTILVPHRIPGVLSRGLYPGNDQHGTMMTQLQIPCSPPAHQP
jgi:hypothetical protein